MDDPAVDSSVEVELPECTRSYEYFYGLRLVGGSHAECR
jgi:hypothetical protein